jgi:hypothetical protein
MKHVFLVTLVLLINAVAFAQSDKFTKAMQSNLAQFDSAKSADDVLALGAAFERIADAEKKQWLPYYYAALAQVTYGFMKGDMSGNDVYADKAEKLALKADSLEANNSEISCLKSMIASMRLMVNPQQRWQQYGPISSMEIEKARSQDKTNPRPYYLQGQGLRFTPEEFGGGCTPAKPLLEEALKKFEAFKPASVLCFSWGKNRAQELLAGCNK